MLRTRVIPCLLLRGRGLVKTIRFKDATYVGDPLNAVKIFNDKQVDELVVLDIDATREGRGPAFEFIEELAGECFMPLGYGGGIRTLEDVRRLLGSGVEKVVLNAAAIRTPALVTEAARLAGNQSIVVSMDVRRKLLGRYEVFSVNARDGTGFDPVQYAVRMEECGAGEILLNAVDRDGTGQGYDVELVRRVADVVSVPVIASCGAANLGHFRQAVEEGHAAAVSAGSMFVFHGKHRAVLISYPTPKELQEILS